MLRWSLLGLALFCLPTALAHDRPNSVSLERLWGFERYILVVATEMDFPVPLVGPGEDAEYRVYLSPKFSSSAARRMYLKSTGRTEDSVLELYDPQSGRTRVSHNFQMERCEQSRRHAARQFLLKMKRRLATP